MVLREVAVRLLPRVMVLREVACGCRGASPGDADGGDAAAAGGVEADPAGLRLADAEWREVHVQHAWPTVDHAQRHAVHHGNQPELTVPETQTL